MLDTADVLALQEQVTATLPDECQIVRPSRSSDGAGGFTETTTLVARTRCRVSPNGQNEAQIAERMSIVAGWSVTLPAGTDVRESDRIVCKGRTWEVAYRLEYPYQIACYTLCREVR